VQARLKTDAALRVYLQELVSSWGGCPMPDSTSNTRQNCK
jgi:hypothetical protein